MHYFLSTRTLVRNFSIQNTQNSPLKQKAGYFPARNVLAISFDWHYTSFPYSITVVHGDFHPLNVLVGKDGSLKVIDFMNLIRVPFLYDVARTYYLIDTSSKDFAEAYLSTMGYKVSDISEYIELVKLYRKLESL